MCDALAVALAVEPECCLESSPRLCTVDVSDRPGSCTFREAAEHEANVQLVTALDMARIQQLLGPVTA